MTSLNPSSRNAILISYCQKRDEPTDGPTDIKTNTPSYKVASEPIKSISNVKLYEASLSLGFDNPEKSRNINSIFLSHSGYQGFFYFSLGTFGKVGGHPGLLESFDEIYIQSKFDISGSNETMQNALAPLF